MKRVKHLFFATIMLLPTIPFTSSPFISPSFASVSTPSTITPVGFVGSSGRIATSSGGQTILMGSRTSLFFSTNGGLTWSSPTGIQSQGWESVAVSGNGEVMLAGASQSLGTNGNVYLSTDHGIHWSVPASLPTNALITGNGGVTVVATLDNKKVFAIVEGSYFVATEADGFASWTLLASSLPQSFVYQMALSFDGQTQLLCHNTGTIDISIDGGRTWNDSGAGTDYWVSCALSADGTKQFVMPINTYGGRVKWRDTSLSSSWSSIGSLNSKFFGSISVSSDGLTLLAVPDGANTYLLTFSGGSWTQSDLGQSSDYYPDAVISANGTTIYKRGGFTVAHGGGSQLSKWTLSLNAPFFVLSSYGETRTVSTLATGFTAFSAGGDFTAYAISAVPPGMNFIPATGSLSGTPSLAAPSTTYTVTATNATGSFSRDFVFLVEAPTVAPVVAPPAIVYVPPMTPEGAPEITFSSSSVTCSLGKYSQSPKSAVFTLIVDNQPVLTRFSNRVLPIWLVPWAGESVDFGVASLTSAEWNLQRAWRGKRIECLTLAYANNATGSTSVTAEVPN